MRASILDFRAKLGNRCKDLLVYDLLRASILDFRPKLGNRCSTIVVAVENGPPAAAVAATNSAADSNYITAKKNGPPATTSLLHGRTARLQHRCEAQAGTGCHEGGIILSKKPPEWRQFPPQQRSASGSNIRCGRGEWFRLQNAVADAGGDWMSRRRHNPKLKAAGVASVPAATTLRVRF